MKTNDISKLELILLEREIPILQAEIKRGMSIVFAAFDKYRPSNPNGDNSIRTTPDEVKELNAFIRKISPLGLSYYSGYHLREGNAGHEMQCNNSLPDCLRNLILDHVVPEFVNRMNAIQSEASEIRDIAEQARDYAANS